MFDKEITSNTIELIIDSIHIVQQRATTIKTPGDFTASDHGMMILDSICMKLTTIGESIKNLDKITNKTLLKKYPQINWKQAMGMRDIIVHHYFDIDAEVIFKTLSDDLPLLFKTLTLIKNEIK